MQVPVLALPLQKKITPTPNPTAMTTAAPLVAISAAAARLLRTIAERSARRPYSFVPAGCNQGRLYAELIAAGCITPIF